MNTMGGKRDEWEFEYTASRLAEAAAAQKTFRLSRLAWWTEAKAKVMAEIKETGLEVSESLAVSALNYTTQTNGPQIVVRADLQAKLKECHGKIGTHQQAAAEYDGWVQMLSANPEARLKLKCADWLYFFGK